MPSSFGMIQANAKIFNVVSDIVRRFETAAFSPLLGQQYVAEVHPAAGGTGGLQKQSYSVSAHLSGNKHGLSWPSGPLCLELKPFVGQRPKRNKLTKTFLHLLIYQLRLNVNLVQHIHFRLWYDAVADCPGNCKHLLLCRTRLAIRNYIALDTDIQFHRDWFLYKTFDNSDYQSFCELEMMWCNLLLQQKPAMFTWVGRQSHRLVVSQNAPPSTVKQSMFSWQGNPTITTESRLNIQ